MADNWGFVAAAYGLAAVVLLIYWRRLVMIERRLDALNRSNAQRSRERSSAERSREPSRTGHPQSAPDSRPPLQ